mgnify:CR=1 FL=1
MKLETASPSGLAVRGITKPVLSSTCWWARYASSSYNTLVKKNQNARDRFHTMRLCRRFLPSALSALVPPRVAFTTVVGINAPNICIERRSFTREIPTFPENIRRRQDGRYRLIVSYCGRCYRCNQLLKDGPRDQGSVHPMTLWVKWYHGGNC